MPLIKSKSKKAFEHNIEAEMSSGKPQKQALAIAYDVKRRNSRKKMAAGGSVQSGSKDMNYADGGKVKPQEPGVVDKVIKAVSDWTDQPDPEANKKSDAKPIQTPYASSKYAQGGMINESAKSEQRPMPKEQDKDAKMISRNSGKKASKNDDWSSDITVQQAQRPSQTKLSQPRMVESGVIRTKLRDQEGNLMDSMPPSSDKDQPSKAYDEEGANRQGPESRDLKLKMMAKGGRVDMEPMDSEVQLMEREDEAHMQSSLDPSEDEGAQDARSRDEIGQDRQGPQVSDMEREHSNGRKPYAEGGSIQHEMMDQPEPEASDDMEDSIAAAVMARMERQKHIHSDSDIDRMAMMAEGGEILSHDSIYSDDSDQADVSRNADEDANEEDQLSFNALRKENYNESEGLEQMDSPMDSNRHGHEIDSDKHDMVDAIRSKMNRQRQFKVR